MNKLRKVIRVFSGVNGWAFFLSVLLLITMCFVMTFEVVMRYAINRPTIWSTEITGYLVLALAFLGAAYVLRMGGHVRVEALTRLLPKKGQQIMNIISSIIAFIYISVLAWQIWRLTLNSYLMDTTSTSFLGTPLYIPQSFMAIGGFLLFVKVIGVIYENIVEFIRK